MKNILVTGASSGIGFSVTQNLLQSGYRVLALSRTKGRIQEIESAYEGSLVHIPIDLLEFDSYRDRLGAIEPVDGVIHSAGMVINNPIKFFNIDKYNAVINLNQTAPVLLTATLIKLKKLNDSSSIVFISSINGPKVAIKGCTAYAASKAALLGIAKVLSLELSSRSIRVNSVLPGMVDTELVDGLSQLTSENIEVDKARYPLQNRYAKPKEIADIIEYLISDRSSFVTGQDFVIDGGYCVN